jgi:hypothetical protein
MASALPRRPLYSTQSCAATASGVDNFGKKHRTKVQLATQLIGVGEEIGERPGGIRL